MVKNQTISVFSREDFPKDFLDKSNIYKKETNNQHAVHYIYLKIYFLATLKHVMEVITIETEESSVLSDYKSFLDTC